jgi:predicted nucleic acid-binding protein
MTSLVVDSSVAIKWFLPEAYSAEASRILEQYKAGALTMIAPDLINAEFGNIVWKKHLYQGVSATDAQSVINEFRKLGLVITPTANLLDEAYRLAVTHKRTVYDCLYLALSLRESCQFVTADEKLTNAVRASISNIVLLADWS